MASASSFLFVSHEVTGKYVLQKLCWTGIQAEINWGNKCARISGFWVSLRSCLWMGVESFTSHCKGLFSPAPSHW
jgi:hypothetical protein